MEQYIDSNFSYNGQSYRASQHLWEPKHWIARFYPVDQTDFTVDIYCVSHFGAAAIPEINWSAMGAQSVEKAVAYAQTIMAAAEWIKSL